MTAAAFLAERARLGEFWTPLVVLDDEAMRSDVAAMARWCRERGTHRGLRRAAVGGRRGLRGLPGARPVAARARRGAAYWPAWPPCTGLSRTSTTGATCTSRRGAAPTSTSSRRSSRPLGRPLHPALGCL